MRVLKSIYSALLFSIMLSTSSLFGMMSSRSLISAVKKDDVAAAQAALNRGADVDAKDALSTTRKTALMLAVEKNSIPMAEFLIKKGANLNARTWLGQTPLIIAAENGLLDMARLLLDKGAALLKASDIPGRIIKGSKVRTALMHAVARGDMPMVKLLLERGADPAIMVGREDSKEIFGIPFPQPVRDANLILPKMQGVSALTLAAATGNKPMVELLLGAGEFDEFDTLHAKRIAAERGHFDIVRLFGEGVIDDVYIAAIEADDIDEVKRLLDKGAYVDSRHYKVFQPGALLSAIIKGNPNMVELLFDHKITYRPGYVFEALKRGNLAVAKVMIDRGHGSLFERGLYKLFSKISGSKKGAKEDISALMRYAMKKVRREPVSEKEFARVKVAARRVGIALTIIVAVVDKLYRSYIANIRAHTSLHDAVGEGSMRKINILLDGGADINAKANPIRWIINPVTPLWYALDLYDRYRFSASRREQYDAIVRYLIKRGATIDTTNSKSLTQLMKSINKNNLRMTRYLLDLGANPDFQNVRGVTALMLAAGNNNQDAIKLLLQRGATVGLRANDGRTAIEFAPAGRLGYEARRLLGGYQEGMERILFEQGARPGAAFAGSEGQQVAELVGAYLLEGRLPSGAGQEPLQESEYQKRAMRRGAWRDAKEAQMTIDDLVSETQALRARIDEIRKASPSLIADLTSSLSRLRRLLVFQSMDADEAIRDAARRLRGTLDAIGDRIDQLQMSAKAPIEAGAGAGAGASASAVEEPGVGIDPVVQAERKAERKRVKQEMEKRSIEYERERAEQERRARRVTSPYQKVFDELGERPLNSYELGMAIRDLNRDVEQFESHTIKRVAPALIKSEIKRFRLEVQRLEKHLPHQESLENIDPSRLREFQSGLGRIRDTLGQLERDEKGGAGAGR